MNFRIGFGYDVHRLEAGIPFMLGGVRIDHHKGARGHSDADVLIHAICDALLGALALGDIGQHFPDTDDSYAGMDSLVLLRKVFHLIEEKGYAPGNIDTSIVLQSPKIQSYIPEMASTIAEALNMESSDVSIKATTEEKLGFTGREEGVAAYAVALLYKNEV